MIPTLHRTEDPGFAPGMLCSLPFSDGSGTNDYCTDIIYLPRSTDDPRLRRYGRDNTVQMHLWIKAYSGSGSNEWVVTPKRVPNDYQPRDNWELFNLPMMRQETLCPRYFTQASLPIHKLYTVRRELVSFVLQFSRTNSGTNVLEVRVEFDVTAPS